MEEMKIAGLTLQVGDDEEIDKFEKLEREWAEERAKRERERAFFTCGIKKKFFPCTFDNYNADNESKKNAVSFLKDFAENKTAEKIVLLYGTYGTGKTHLASALLKSGGQYITSFELCVQFEMGSDYKADRNKMQVLDFFSSANDLLVIDEFGRGLSATEKILIPYFIDRFYAEEKKLVIITNLDVKDFCASVGKASYDRLLEVGKSIKIEGESYRKGGKKCE